MVGRSRFMISISVTHLWSAAVVGLAPLVGAGAEIVSRPGEYIVTLPQNRAQQVISRLSTAGNKAGTGQLAAAKAPGAEPILENAIYLRLGLSTSTGRPTERALAGLAAAASTNISASDLQAAFAAQLGLRTSEIEVTPNYVGRLVKEPNDSKYDSVQKPYMSQIHMPRAWDIRTDAGPIIVAVLDSGIMYSHEDLATNMLRGPKGIVLGYDFYDNTPDPAPKFLPISSALNPKTGRCEASNASQFQLKGYEQHGTRVASIIGAVGNNQLGVAGVAWTVKLMPVRVAEDGASCSAVDLASVIKGIRFAVDNGARLINASWEGFPFNAPLRDAIQYASAKGVLFITAAGNHPVDLATTPTYPQSFGLSNMIVVASVDTAGRLSDFSSYGSNTVDLAAPGEAIYGAVPRQFLPQLTADYNSDRGTSFAAPIVTGLAALMLSANRTLAGPDVKRMILATIDNGTGLQGKIRTAGIVNADKALSAAVEALVLAGPSNQGSLAASRTLSPTDLKEIEAALASIASSGTQLTTDQVAAAIPNRYGLSEAQYSQLVQDLVAQSSYPNPKIASEQASQRLVVEIGPDVDHTKVVKRLSKFTKSPVSKLDDKTFVLSVNPSTDTKGLMNRLSNEPGVTAVYPLPMGTLIK